MDGDQDNVISAKAEEVRAYLVALRGGAPFLSGPDGRVLVAWLEAGVSVLAITAAIDRVAERRRAKRVKSRMSLWACRTELTRVQAEPAPTPIAAPATVRGIEGWIADLGRLPEAACPLPPRLRLLADLGSIGEGATEERAQRALRAVRQFHEAVWDSLGDERLAVEEEARKELGSLGDGLDELKLRAAIEEVARDRVRARFPLVSAKVAWDRLREEERAG
jgi:hypothetical protein